jgi:hypothetical protein
MSHPADMQEAGSLSCGQFEISQKQTFRDRSVGTCVRIATTSAQRSQGLCRIDSHTWDIGIGRCEPMTPRTKSSRGQPTRTPEQRYGIENCKQKRTSQHKEHREAKRTLGFVSDDDTRPIQPDTRSCQPYSQTKWNAASKKLVSSTSRFQCRRRGLKLSHACSVIGGSR